MTFLSISILKVITATKPAALLMWTTVTCMYSTGEVATLVAELPIEPSYHTEWFVTLIYHGSVITLLTVVSPCCSPVIPLIASPLFPLICERLYSLWS